MCVRDKCICFMYTIYEYIKLDCVADHIMLVGFQTYRYEYNINKPYFGYLSMHTRPQLICEMCCNIQIMYILRVCVYRVKYLINQ